MADDRSSSGNMVLGLILGLLGLLIGLGLMRNVIAPSLLPVGSFLAQTSGWIPGLQDEAARVQALNRDRTAAAKAMRASTDRAVAFLSDSGALLLPWMIVGSVGIGIWLIRRSPRGRYSRTINLDQLIEMQSKAFPRIRPALFLAGRMRPEERGPFTTLESPYAWCSRNGVFTADAPQATWRSDRAQAAFAAQLSVEVKEYHRWLIAAFGLMAEGNIPAGDRLLDDLAKAFDAEPVEGHLAYRLKKALGLWKWDRPVPGPLRYRMVLSAHLQRSIDEAFARVMASATWESVTKLHAHIESRLCALLALAQRKTLLPPGGFLWVKALDRGIWYALHAVGMQPSCTEAAGVRSHMRAEQAAGAAIAQPDVQAAVDALYAEMDTDSWRPPRGIKESDVSWMDDVVATSAQS